VQRIKNGPNLPHYEEQKSKVTNKEEPAQFGPSFWECPHSWALPLIKHARKFIINQAYVDLLNSGMDPTSISRHNFSPSFEVYAKYPSRFLGGKIHGYKAPSKYTTNSLQVLFEK
jgi:hypothetical protein